ncbi:MAG: site-2 protease family protein [Opitutaceae bacterium]|jgi:hypothetical protein
MIPLAILAARYDDSPYDKGSPVGIVILWIVGFVISYSLIVVHELGHWLAARCTGLEISDITIGHWRRLVSFSIKGVTANLRAAPSSGYVTLKPSLNMYSAPRMIVFLLAGVVAEGCFIIAIACTVTAPDNIHSFGDMFVAFCLINIVFVGGYHTLLNLRPVEGYVGGDKVPTDGLQLLRLWKFRRERPAQCEFFRELQQVNSLCREGRFADALEIAYPLVKRHPDSIDLWQGIGALHQQTGELDKTEAIWRELITRSGMNACKLAELLDNLSCLPLYYGRTHLLAEADAWTNEAMRHAPNAITLKATRGGVLIELGRIDEGLRFLSEAIKRSECPEDQTMGAAFMAKASAAKGDHAEARRWLAKAQALNAKHPLVKRITSELSPVRS